MARAVSSSSFMGSPGHRPGNTLRACTSTSGGRGDGHRFEPVVLVVAMLGLCCAPLPIHVGDAASRDGRIHRYTAVGGDRTVRPGVAPEQGRAQIHGRGGTPPMPRRVSRPRQHLPPGHPTRALIGYVLIGLVVTGWLVVFVVRARGRRAPRAAPVPFLASTEHVATARPMNVPENARRPRDVGWHSDPDHMSEQVYWDGRAWTARRRWSGESWVDVQQGPPN